MGTSPARGPVPAFGDFASVREDGAADVYLMRLAGPLSHTLNGASDGFVFVKIGRSAEPSRRLEELNWGYPPGCGLSWRIEGRRTFAYVGSAHDFKQALLERLHRASLTVGGEYAHVPEDLVPCLLDGAAHLDDKSAPDGHLRNAAVDASQGRRGWGRVTNYLQDQELITSLESEAGIAPGLLSRLLSLETDFPDLNARGARRELYRAVEGVLDAEADRSKTP